MGEVEPLTDRAPFKPSRTQLTSAVGKWVPDVIVPHLRVLFCGINPGLYSAATGHHFARPGNRFWRALHGAGFTRRLLSPWEEPALLKCGYGVTNLVARATASADEIDAAELVTGRRRLLSKVRRYAPACVASKAVRSSLRRRARQTALVGGEELRPIGRVKRCGVRGGEHAPAISASAARSSIAAEPVVEDLLTRGG